MERSDLTAKINGARRVAIKVGTSLLTDSNNPDGVNYRMVEQLRDEVAFLLNRNIRPIIISSGAVGLGRAALKQLKSGYKPESEPKLVRRQALAAIGQNRLLTVYGEAFAEHQIPVAQILITARDFLNRRSYLNIGNTIEELTKMGVLPIINENDTVSTEELRYGDNDLLSAACASLFHADLLVILTSVSGFIYNEERLSLLTEIERNHQEQAHGPEGPGTGGMQTKLRAAELCMQAGEMMAILPGREREPIRRLFDGDDLGTLFYNDRKRKRLSARKRWLLYARTRGQVEIDTGAAQALKEQGTSLLSAGIVKSSGHFLAGDIIDIVTGDATIVGRGITNYSYREVMALVREREESQRESVSGPRIPEIIHRNNLILEQAAP